MTGKDDDGFLSRWSRRKREGEQPEPPESPELAEPDPEPDEESEAFDPADLPDPETLGPGDDFAQFLRKRVPEELRRRALRQLWRSNPVLACVDGLNDYDGDFTGGTVPRGELKTAFQVGRGMVRDVVAKAVATEPDAAFQQPEAAAAPENAPQEEVEEAELAADSEAQETEQVRLTEELDSPAPTRRRMRFRFPDEG